MSGNMPVRQAIVDALTGVPTNGRFIQSWPQAEVEWIADHILPTVRTLIADELIEAANEAQKRGRCRPNSITDWLIDRAITARKDEEQ